jgi:hypothetical protein
MSHSRNGACEQIALTPAIVIPAKAGTQPRCHQHADAAMCTGVADRKCRARGERPGASAPARLRRLGWVPAFAGMTRVVLRGQGGAS